MAALQQVGQTFNSVITERDKALGKNQLNTAQALNHSIQNTMNQMNKIKISNFEEKKSNAPERPRSPYKNANAKAQEYFPLSSDMIMNDPISFV